MILIDANLLLYAYGSSSEMHEKARQWMEEVFSRPEPVRLAWANILAFLRISTHTRMRGEPFLIDEAVTIVKEWLAQPNVRILGPGERHWSILGKLLSGSQARGPLVVDTHLAALAIEHGATLCTTDRDFLRFPELRAVYPLSQE